MKLFIIILTLVVLATITGVAYKISHNPATAPATTSAEHPATATPATAAVPASQTIQKEPATPRALFKEPVEPHVFELASAALTTWRDHAAAKPTLVLFSTHPFLGPLRSENKASIRKSVLTTPAVELIRASRLQTANPVFISPQAVSVAIEAGLIGELVFVQPTTQKASAASLSAFQQNAFASGFLTEKEALGLRLTNGVIHGTVRGIPFRCVHPDSLPAISQPVIVHIDLSYFMDIFVNDVKTPVYNLLYQTARNIRDAGWPAVAITLSYSNQEAEFSLDTRFLISNLATILVNPTLLDGGTPPSWQLRSDARLARAMFNATIADDLTTRAVEVSPDDADALYALSQLKLAQRQIDEAFTLLDHAVKLDPGYALAYLQLAETAVDLGQWDKAEALFGKARQHLSDNPFIDISLAELLIRRTRGKEARALLAPLQQQHWSTLFHAKVPDLLREMLVMADAQIAPAKKP